MSSFKHLIGEAQLLRDLRRHEALPYEVSLVPHDDLDQVQRVRRFVADQNIRRGNLSPDKVGKDGTVLAEHDPQRTYTQYFRVEHQAKDSDSPAIAAVGGLTKPTLGRGLDSLQLHWDDLPPESVNYVKSIPLNKLAEFRSLVKHPAAPRIVTQYLFRDMLKYSIEEGIDHWLFGLQPKVTPTYKKMFGSCMTQLGERVRLGSFTTEYVPFIVNIPELYDRFTKEKMHGLRGMLAGAAIKNFYLDGAPKLGPDAFSSSAILQTESSQVEDVLKFTE